MDLDRKPDRLVEDLRRRYGELLERKRRFAHGHHCSVCGLRSTTEGTWFCLECGTAYGMCRAQKLSRTVHRVKLDFNGLGITIGLRCRCGGRVG